MRAWTVSSTARGTTVSGIVAFDNSGTLSEPTVAVEQISPEYEWLESVTAVSPNRGKFALLNVVCPSLETVQSDAPLDEVLTSEDVTLRPALSNCDVPDDILSVLTFEQEVPTRTLAEVADAAVSKVRNSQNPGRWAVSLEEELPTGVQLVVDLSAGRIVRVVGYTSIPYAEAPDVVDRVRDDGFEPHLVSGDATNILRHVGELVGIPADNVHSFQSATDKRRTLETLSESDPAVMVGDYVNDRYAFEVADLGIFIDSESDVSDRLGPIADTTIESLSTVPTVLEQHAQHLQQTRRGD